MTTLPMWVGALATVILAAVAVFQDRIRRWVMSPRLELRVRVAPPDCHYTIWRIQTPGQHPTTKEPVVIVRDLPCYYFRLGVMNSGKTEAREVELFAAALKRKRADGSFEEVPRFTPMSLLWAHVRTPNLPILCPEMPKVCDMAHAIAPQYRKILGHNLPGVQDNKAILAFDLQVEPNMLGHLAEPGTYRLDLVLGAANVSAKRYTLEIIFPGEWFDDEARMLRDGFRMRVV